MIIYILHILLKEIKFQEQLTLFCLFVCLFVFCVCLCFIFIFLIFCWVDLKMLDESVAEDKSLTPLRARDKMSLQGEVTCEFPINEKFQDTAHSR